MFSHRLQFRARAACGLLVACACACTVFAGGAAAAPITVNLRVEGSAATLFEGPVSTSAETIETTSSGGPHPCNYTENGGSEALEGNGGPASATPTTALHDAALASGLTFNAEWFGNKAHGGSPGDFFVTQVGPDINQTSAPFDAWGYAVQDTTAPVGGCQIALSPGSEVLWAYNYFNLPHLLSLSGPTSVNVGTPFTVHVADGKTGESLAGATIGELIAGITKTSATSPTTNASGNATVTISRAGELTLKATRNESVRSNGLALCVHAGDDGTCGAPGPTTGTGSSTPPSAPSKAGTAIAAEITGLIDRHRYSRRHAPRLITGQVTSDAGIKRVELRLTRTARTTSGHRRCSYYDGSTGLFHTMRCGAAHGRFFSVGNAASFSYLLPFALPRGHYVLDLQATDGAGQRTPLARGSSRVVFDVG
jgi:hypothetical protein